MIMVSKKSQAHVEIILATTLFVGFLIFAFVFLNSSIKTTKDIPTDKIERAIFGELSEEVGKLSVVVKDNCYSLGEVNDEYGLDFYEVFHGAGRYTIYYGNFFDKNQIRNCNSGDEDEFVFGGYSEEEMIVKGNIIDFKALYEEDYSGLKQTLGVDNFVFEFKGLDNKRIEDSSPVERKIPGSVDVISKDFPVRVINERAEISELILNIKVWR
jgi:hypothetical protein